MINTEDKKTIEMLAVTIAHEVKNPLSLIKANIDYIELCDINNVHADCYEVMKNEIVKANDIIMKFIEYMKPLNNVLVEIDLYSILNDICNTYSSAHQNKIKFSLYNKNYKNITGDKEKIKILFNNIFKNAVDSLLSTSSNNNLIKINFLVKDDFLITEIEDNGIGIDKNTIEQLNNKQYYSTKENGSGLGINICKRIVSDHNGEYSIQNSTTGGCIVRVSLPINKKS